MCKIDDIINLILKQNISLFSTITKVEKINIGFTNTIYNINDLYIVKICTNIANEENFKKEINFYQFNKDNNFIPKLYYYDFEKQNVPYCYEILEKVEGVTLYHIWHTLSEEQREEIIRQLCEAMKKIHANKGNRYNWSNTLKEQFNSLYNQVKKLNIFKEEELKLLDDAYAKFAKYLVSNDFVLIHNDIHFDNIIYNNGKIKLIDFERSMYAPKDFELNIISKMVRKPWDFASQETEDYTNSSDYTNIMLYIEKYYKELINIDYLSQRLAIYDIIYYLKHLIQNPKLEKLKKDIIMAAKVVVLKDEMTFDNLKTPTELMDFMDINIEYGWLDKFGNKHLNTLKGFRENYRISSIKEILETRLGTCIEQAKLIKCFFDKIGFENKLYCYRSYETENNLNQEVKMHCFVLYYYQGNWYHFEHSNPSKKGIYKYKTIEQAILNITNDIKEEGCIKKLTEIDTIPDNLSFKEFNNYVNSYDEKIIEVK